MEYDKEKFTSVLSYVINRCENEKNVEKTVLCKLMYFSDFDSEDNADLDYEYVFYRDPEYSVRDYDGEISD